MTIIDIIDRSRCLISNGDYDKYNNDDEIFDNYDEYDFNDMTAMTATTKTTMTTTTPMTT